MKFKILSFVLLLLIQSGAIAQQGGGQNAYRNTIYGVTENLIRERLQQTPTDQSGKIAASVKEIKRIREIMGPRLFPHGDVKKVFPAYQQYIEDFNNGNRGFCGIYDDVEWEPKGPNDLPDGISWILGTGQINRVTFSPGYNGASNQTIYGCSHYGGAFKSTDAGANWSILGTDLQLPFSGVADLGVDHANENNLFIAASKGDGKKDYMTVAATGMVNPNPTAGMYRSTNGGTTWENISDDLLDDFDLGGLIRRVVVDPTNANVVLIATTNGIYRSANALSASPTWTLTTSGFIVGDPDMRGLEFKPGDHNVVYASGKHIYRSVDNGVNWVKMTPAFSSLDLETFRPFAPSNTDVFEVQQINLAVTPADPNRIYAYIVAKDVAGTGHNFALIYLYDGGLWTQIDDFEATSVYNVVSGGWIGIAVSPVNANAVYYGYTHVRGTQDFTTSGFATQSLYSGSGFHADVHDLVFEPIAVAPKLYCGHHGGVSSKDISVNGIGGWSYHNKGLHCGLIWSFDNSLIKKDQYVIGSQDLGVSVHASGASNWRTIQGGDGYGVQIYDEEDFMVMGKGNGSIRSFQIDDDNSTLYSAFENSSLPMGHVHSTSFQEEIPLMFQVRYHPITHAPIFGINDLHERIKLKKSGGDGAADLWKSQSNLGFLGGYEWIYSRRVSDFEIAPSNPKYAYVVVQGMIRYNSTTSAYEVLKPGIFRTTSGLTNGDEALASFVNITGGLPTSAYTTPEGDPAHLVITGVEVDPRDENRIWVSFSGYEATKKVWHSTNAGGTWTNYDPTGKLANLPVNDIVYQPGSEDRIFAATDAGVYVKEPGVEWCRYGNIPNVRVMEVAINPCDQSLSAATVGRGLWEAPIPHEAVVATFRTITSNETWADEVYSTGNIIVKPGKTLTITGTLNMPKRGKIMVEPGGRLKVKGGTLTNACGDFWGGIEAWGVTSLGQNSNNQAEVTLSQGAIIEHAEVAIDCWKPGDWAATGGVARAYNSTFRNNNRDIAMMRYSNDYGGNHYDNRSKFVDTDFYWDDDYRREVPLGHVALYKVDGVYFTGCRFADNRTAPTLHNNNVGIRAIDAAFKVLGSCVAMSGCSNDIEDGNWNPGRFDNLKYGIYASNFSTEHTITVDRTIFTNNQYGVQLVGLNSPILVRNIIRFTGAGNLYAGLGMKGFWLNETKGLRVEENRFENLASPAASIGKTTGVGCINLGGTEEEIYKNEFRRLTYGNIAIGKNRSAGVIPGSDGLQFRCNTNIDNEHDHHVFVDAADWSNPASGVRSLNGSLSEASGNTFSTLGAPCEDYENVSPYSITYIYHTAAPVEVCGLVPSLSTTNAASCPTNFPAYPITELPAANKYQLEQRFLSGKSALAQKESQYLSLIDGGNTAMLLQTVNQMSSSTAGQVRQQLLSISPFVTEAVVRAAVNKPTQVFSHAWAHELITSNLEVAKSPDFRTFLAQKNEPLPNWMQADIQQRIAQGQITARLTMESEISDLKQEVGYAADMLVRNAKLVTGAIDFNELRTWILNTGDEMGRTQVVETYLQEEKWNKAVAELSQINNGMSSAPAHLVGALTDYVTFKQSLVNLLVNPSKIANLGQNELNFVRNMAQNGRGIARLQAQELLCFFYGECVDYSVQLPGSKQAVNSATAAEGMLETAFEVFPNPAKDRFTVSLKGGAASASLAILDMQGRKVLQQTFNEAHVSFETSNLVDGIYFISVVVNGRRVGVEKLVIQH